jgi:hypothetical protein
VNEEEEKKNIELALAWHRSGFYHCVCIIDLLLDRYKSNQIRKYLEFMVDTAKNEVGEERWEEMVHEQVEARMIHIFKHIRKKKI